MYPPEVTVTELPIDHHLEHLRMLVRCPVDRGSRQQPDVVLRPRCCIIASMNHDAGTTPQDRYSGGTATYSPRAGENNRP